MTSDDPPTKFSPSRVVGDEPLHHQMALAFYKMIAIRREGRDGLAFTHLSYRPSQKQVNRNARLVVGCAFSFVRKKARAPKYAGCSNRLLKAF
jgi:hypothetical protein